MHLQHWTVDRVHLNTTSIRLEGRHGAGMVGARSRFMT